MNWECMDIFLVACVPHRILMFVPENNFQQYNVRNVGNDRHFVDKFRRQKLAFHPQDIQF